MRYTGVTSRGIITPIFQQGDDLIAGVTSSIVKASAEEGFALHDGDVVGVTEAVVARTQGNYATCDQIVSDVRAKLGDGVIGLVFPILSRNRFAIMLRAFARAAGKLVVQLSYPSDEVGNPLLSWDQVDAAGVDPFKDSFTLEQFRAKFGNDTVHKFTGVEYIEY